MSEGEPKEPARVIPFERGMEIETERAELKTRLEAYLNGMSKHYREWARVMADSFDNAEEDKILPKLEVLKNRMNRGTSLLENIKTINPQEIETYISENYEIKP